MAAAGVPGKEGQAAATGTTSSSSTGGTSVAVPHSNVTIEGYDGNGEDPDKRKLPKLLSSHYIPDEARWIEALLRSLGQIKRGGAGNFTSFSSKP